MKIAVVADVPIDDRGVSIRKGSSIRQSLLWDDAADGLNFKFFRSRWRDGADTFESPRHHHSFQQLRWTEKGSVNFAPGRDIAEGNLGYFPRGTWYGPQRKDGGITISLQLGFGGEHQEAGDSWAKYRKEARKHLDARGTFEGGFYVDVDPETGSRRQRDAFEALYDETSQLKTGEPFTMPPEGYEDAIIIRPNAFAYFQESPGVERRNLGNFYDHPGRNADLRISMVKLAAGGLYCLGPERAQVAWSKTSGLVVDGRTYPELTCLYSSRDEAVEIRGEGGVEVYVAECPRLD
jgi:hypothetical protein